MSTKPKNFTQALDELEQYTSLKAQDLKSKLSDELQGLEEKLESLKPRFEELKNRAGQEARRAKGKVEEQVKDNPWAAIGIVGLIFLVLGFLLKGSSSRRND